MRLDELVDVPIYHPFRRHCEFVMAHCRSQQRQHVRMTKRFPRHNFLAEPLRVGISLLGYVVAWHICNLHF